MSLTAFFDGACLFPFQGGHASHGAIIYRDQELIWKEAKLVVPEQNTRVTNNVAEYSGYIAVVEELSRRDLKEQPVTIYGDSKLVIDQMAGQMKIKKGAYVSLALKAKRLTEIFVALRPLWIPREENNEADALTRKALLDAGLICALCLEKDQPYQKWCFCSCHTCVEQQVVSPS
jgi:ribonuclease HI